MKLNWNMFRSEEIVLQSNLTLEECVQKLRDYAQRGFLWPWKDNFIRLDTNHEVPDGIFNGNKFRLGKVGRGQLLFQCFYGQLLKTNKGTLISGYFDISDWAKFSIIISIVVSNSGLLFFFLQTGHKQASGIIISLFLLIFLNSFLFFIAWISFPFGDKINTELLASLQNIFEADIIEKESQTSLLPPSN
jgi:hypothetical protein